MFAALGRMHPTAGAAPGSLVRVMRGAPASPSMRAVTLSREARFGAGGSAVRRFFGQGSTRESNAPGASLSAANTNIAPPTFTRNIRLAAGNETTIRAGLPIAIPTSRFVQQNRSNIVGSALHKTIANASHAAVPQRLFVAAPPVGSPRAELNNRDRGGSVTASATRVASVQLVAPTAVGKSQVASPAQLRTIFDCGSSNPANRGGDTSRAPSFGPITINSNPTINLTSEASTDLESRMLATLRAHREAIFEEMQRELDRRQRTHF